MHLKKVYISFRKKIFTTSYLFVCYNWYLRYIKRKFSDGTSKTRRFHFQQTFVSCMSSVFKELLIHVHHVFGYHDCMSLICSNQSPFYIIDKITDELLCISIDVFSWNFLFLYFQIRIFAHDEVNVHCSPAKKVFFSTIANFIISAF